MKSYEPRFDALKQSTHELNQLDNSINSKNQNSQDLINDIEQFSKKWSETYLLISRSTFFIIFFCFCLFL
jgi:hypothetical protein